MSELKAANTDSEQAVSPLVSILVPSYNAAPYLRQLCESLQAQSYTNFEALILDDGSSDNTKGVAAPFLSDRRFQYIDGGKNRGLNMAWHELLQLAKGEFWVSPGADDMLLPDFLAQRVKLLQLHPGAVLAHGPAHHMDEQGNTIPAPFRAFTLPPMMTPARALEVLLQHNIINQPSALVRSAVTKKLLPLFRTDWKYAPDWYLWILHAADGMAIVWDDQPRHIYRWHSRSLSLDPAKASLRNAEIRLVPLCALSLASQSSALAMDCWNQWKTSLYALWLRRALKLKLDGTMQEHWSRYARDAFYGCQVNRTYPWSEWLAFGPAILKNAWKERCAHKQQAFPVSGLAQINDPIFKN